MCSFLLLLIFSLVLLSITSLTKYYSKCVILVLLSKTCPSNINNSAVQSHRALKLCDWDLNLDLSHFRLGILYDIQKVF